MDAHDWDQRYATRDYVWTDSVNGFVEQHLSPLPAGTAVDLGGGEGRNAVWLARRGWTVTAVDFSAIAADKGRRLAEDHGVDVDFVTADALVWEPVTPVDLVVLSYLQLPGPQRRKVLQRAASWVAPGGSLLVVAHDAANVEHGHGGPPSAEVCYDLDETLAALSPLTIDVGEVARRTVPLDDGTSATALDTVVLAHRG